MEKNINTNKSHRKYERRSVDKCHSDSTITTSSLDDNDLMSIDIKKYINDLIIATSLKKISNFFCFCFLNLQVFFRQWKKYRSKSGERTF